VSTMHQHTVQRATVSAPGGPGVASLLRKNDSLGLYHSMNGAGAAAVLGLDCATGRSGRCYSMVPVLIEKVADLAKCQWSKAFAAQCRTASASGLHMSQSLLQAVLVHAHCAS